jgi:hypothetical protein
METDEATPLLMDHFGAPHSSTLIAVSVGPCDDANSISVHVGRTQKNRMRLGNRQGHCIIHEVQTIKSSVRGIAAA